MARYVFPDEKPDSSAREVGAQTPRPREGRSKRRSREPPPGSREPGRANEEAGEDEEYEVSEKPRK